MISEDQLLLQLHLCILGILGLLLENISAKIAIRGYQATTSSTILPVPIELEIADTQMFYVLSSGAHRQNLRAQILSHSEHSHN